MTSNKTLWLLNILNEAKRNNEQTLDLRSRFVDEKDAIALAEVLKESRVHTLNLSGNNLGDVGIKALAEALKESRIQTLSLDMTAIDSEGKKALIEGIKGTNITQVITPPFGIDTRELLANVLKENIALQKNRMMALGQAAIQNGLPPELLSRIIPYTQEGQSGPSTIAGSAGLTKADDVAKNAYVAASRKEAQQHAAVIELEDLTDTYKKHLLTAARQHDKRVPESVNEFSQLPKNKNSDFKAITAKLKITLNLLAALKEQDEAGQIKSPASPIESFKTLLKENQAELNQHLHKGFGHRFLRASFKIPERLATKFNKQGVSLSFFSSKTHGSAFTNAAQEKLAPISKTSKL